MHYGIAIVLECAGWSRGKWRLVYEVEIRAQGDTSIRVRDTNLIALRRLLSSGGLQREQHRPLEEAVYM